MTELTINAIVFDANVFGRKVEPNVETIQRWAEACESHGAELWIPEVVAWELASRVVDEAGAFRQQVLTHNQQRRKWGLPLVTVPDLVDAGTVVNAIGEAGAVIVPVTEEIALEALTDQILLRGPASRKHNVKTGAADSAWIRSVVQHNDYDTVGLIFVSGDVEALNLTCEALGVESPQIVKHLGEIGNLLDAVTDADAEQTELFAHAIHETFGDPESAEADLIQLADLEQPWRWWEPDLRSDFSDGGGDWELQETFISSITDVDVLGQIRFDLWSRSLTGPVRLSVDVEEQYARQDAYGNSVEHRAARYRGSVLGEVTLSTLSSDRSPVFAEPDELQLEVEEGSEYVSPI